MGFWVFKGYVSAYSALLGGAIFSFPQLYFGLKAFRYMGARSSHLIVQNFYRGESTKILLIAVSFACVFKLVEPLDVFALFFVFVVNVLGNAIAPLLSQPKER